MNQPLLLDKNSHLVEKLEGHIDFIKLYAFDLIRRIAADETSFDATESSLIMSDFIAHLSDLVRLIKSTRSLNKRLACYEEYRNA